jgi:hypothetical protein
MASFAFAGVMQAVKYTHHSETNIYTDGGVCCYYPISCFDGKIYNCNCICPYKQISESFSWSGFTDVDLPHFTIFQCPDTLCNVSGERPLTFGISERIPRCAVFMIWLN